MLWTDKPEGMQMWARQCFLHCSSEKTTPPHDGKIDNGNRPALTCNCLSSVSSVQTHIPFFLTHHELLHRSFSSLRWDGKLREVRGNPDRKTQTGTKIGVEHLLSELQLQKICLYAGLHKRNPNVCLKRQHQWTTVTGMCNPVFEPLKQLSKAIYSKRYLRSLQIVCSFFLQ